ncbi:MAG: PorT family protein [Lewinellaceae bacterium]|nr:PorT family protein [Lewinellaceae bacterium]
MDPKRTNDEQIMRDKMLRHEFPFDEKAWESMEALLDQERQTGPPPPPPPDTKPGPAKWTPTVVLLVALLAGLAVWWPGNRHPEIHAASEENLDKSDRRTNSAQPRIKQADAPANAKMAVEIEGGAQTQNLPTGVPGRAGENPGAGRHSRQTETIRAKKTPDAATAPETRRVHSSSQPPRRHETESGRKISAGEPGAAAPNALFLPQQGGGLAAKGKDALDNRIGKQPGAALPVLAGMETHEGSTAGSGTGMPESPDAPTADRNRSKNLGAEAVGVLAPVPVLPLYELPLPCPADSFIRPVPDPTRPRSRWERGWIFGAGANTVDYNPFRLNMLPHFGHLLRYRLHPKTALQAELVLKPVSGYGWRAEFLDIVPTGSAQVILENNNLLFFEVPIVVQHRYAPDQAWLVGLKPSWNVSVFPYGSFSVTNFNTPSRNYTAHSGIRYFDLGLVLGWEWRFGRRWALDVRYNQGLFDLTIDNFYKSRDIHLNSDLQVSLRRFITKKMRRHVPDTNLYPAPAGR